MTIHDDYMTAKAAADAEAAAPLAMLAAAHRPADPDAPTVWVGVIEWGSEYDDIDPEVFLGDSRAAVARAAALGVVEFWVQRVVHDNHGEGEREWVIENPLNPDDPDAVQTWLDAYREQFTAAWVTLTEKPILTA